MTTELGRIEHIDAREVWPHEAHDLTPWLLDNAEILGEVLKLDIELNEAEHPVGSFSLDLIGRDLTNDCVLIVENQLEQTDHGHLGQLLTYAAGTTQGQWFGFRPRSETSTERLSIFSTTLALTVSGSLVLNSE